MPNLINWAIPGFILLLVVEAVISAIDQRELFETKDTFASLAMGIGNVVTNLVAKAIVLGAFWVVYDVTGFFKEMLAPSVAWTWVVLQEQSTLGTPYDQDEGVLGPPDAFHAATRALAAMIRDQEATPALYMTWAKQAFPGQSETLSRAYRSIGAELGLEVAAVGEAWVEVARQRPAFELYITDGSHPNAAGSYLAACALYAALTGRSPIGAPRELSGAPWDFGGLVTSSAPTILVSLPASEAAFLQQVAWEVVRAQEVGSGH